MGWQIEPGAQKTIAEPDAGADGLPADILVVDDNPANFAAIEVALDDLGHRLVKASSGREALRQLLKREFALILLDVQMPGMDGFETARMIRSMERTRHVPIIFITAYDQDDEDVLRGYSMGAVDFLFKPIIPTVLRAKVRVFVDLQERTAEVKRQADRLRELERLEMERTLVEERHNWETKRLREENRRKDEFLAMLAHELRNPLSPLVTGLELIDNFGIKHEGLKRTCQSMNRQVHHLVRLVDDLLDVSRFSRGKIALHKQPLDLAQVMDDAVDSVRAMAESRDQTIEVVPPQGRVCADVDPVRIGQVVGNLLNNAIRYTDPGGEIRLSWAVDGDQAVIRVADNGQGIAESMLEPIFESFVQENQHSQGLGLGLSMVKRLVQMHAGQVRAYSNGPGRGSEFVVRLPAIDQARKAGPASAGKPVEVNGKALRIAVVEDDDDVRGSMKAFLESQGHTVSEAADGAQGMQLILDSRPDVAIVDIGLPILDGYALARNIRRSMTPIQTRLIAVTGYGQAGDRAQALESGFDEHLTKPADPTKLMRALRSNLDGQDSD